MIGYVDTGKSFLGCIAYDLEDKLELTEEQKKQLSIQDGLQHKNRAEVLYFNQCFGDKYELADQFREVARLSKRVEKPVFHFAIRLAPGDSLHHNELTEIGQACTKEFGVQDNQYLIIFHKDTEQPHIHIVANRVGFDGKVASDSNSYRRMAALCRMLEKRYGLKEVLSPRRFLPKEQRSIPRHDRRKEKLKNDIRKTLQQVISYQGFVETMQKLGYTILKGRGIAFIDNKKVKIKGSEVGFSLAKIEKILSLRQHLEVNKAKQQLHEIAIRQAVEKSRPVTVMDKFRAQIWQEAQLERNPVVQVTNTLMKELNHLLYELTKPDHTSQTVNPELLREAKRKKKRKRPSW